MEAAWQHWGQRRRFLCFSAELEEESREQSSLDAAPLGCRCTFRLSISTRVCLALGAAGRVQGRGGRLAQARLGAVWGRSACAAGLEKGWSWALEQRGEPQLAATACFSWSQVALGAL